VNKIRLHNGQEADGTQSLSGHIGGRRNTILYSYYIQYTKLRRIVIYRCIYANYRCFRRMLLRVNVVSADKWKPPQKQPKNYVNLYCTTCKKEDYVAPHSIPLFRKVNSAYKQTLSKDKILALRGMTIKESSFLCACECIRFILVVITVTQKIRALESFVVARGRWIRRWYIELKADWFLIRKYSYIFLIRIIIYVFIYLLLSSYLIFWSGWFSTKV
jgi:hypothetical protein